VSDTYAHFGSETVASARSHFNATSFLIERILNRAATATLGQVQAVTNTPGQVTAVGQVDVLPLVNQIDGSGNATPHQVVHGLPYFRFQGGSNAVLCDPQVGDIGLVVFCDRDISSVKASGKQANPGSRRRFDMADGIFIGLCLGGAPNQYIAFTGSGISIVDKNGNSIVMGPGGVTINGAQINQSGDVISAAGIDLNSHVHTGVTTGTSNSGPPKT